MAGWSIKYGSKEYVLAVGAVSVAFNHLEGTLAELFGAYTHLPQIASDALFLKLTNEVRLNTVRQCIPNADMPTAIKDDTNYFLRGYARCAENRNVLMHSSLHPGDTFDAFKAPAGHSLFVKPRKDAPDEFNIYCPSTDELWEIAESCSDFSDYGMAIWIRIRLHQGTEVPPALIALLTSQERPALPKFLSPQPLGAPKAPSCPPEPSQA